MAIRVTCPACQMSYDIEESFRGKQVVCSKCNQRFQIGGAPAPVPQAVLAEEPLEVVPATEEEIRGSRPKKKSHVMAWVVLGSTFFIVIGVVVVVLLYLTVFADWGEEERKAAKEVKARATGQPKPPPQPTFGPEDDPQTAKAANYVNPPLSGGAEGFHHFRANVAAPREDGKDQKSPQNTESMSSEVLNRVKRATVYIRVERGEGHGGTGSGFFCFEKGLVVTNAHVIGMTSPSDPLPSKVEVIVFSNERDELRLRGSVRQVDRKMDLAIISVPVSDKLPEPMPLVSSSTLELLQRVFVVGFPFGERLGKDVTISPTSVSSLRKEKGVLRTVQVSGGMNQGNSGGPVVDTLGRVIGIAVSIFVTDMKNTGLNFAVPSDYAYHLARGNVNELNVLPALKDATGLQLPLQATLTDPMRRINKVAAECWAGPAGADRPSSHTPPAKEKGDGDTVTQELKVERMRVNGLIKLPPCPEGQVYWVRLVLEDKMGKRWTTAHSFKANPRQALQRVAWHPQPAEAAAWKSDWFSSFEGIMNLGMGRTGSPLEVHLHNAWDENGTGGRKQSKIEVGLKFSEASPPHRELVARLFARHPEGLPPVKDDTSRLSSLGKYYLQALQGTLEKTFGSLEPASPTKSIQPLESWQQRHDFPLDCLMVLSSAPQMRFQYTYLGMGQHQGRPQAIVVVEGTRVETPENGTKATLSGIAAVDIASRKISFLYATVGMETVGAFRIDEIGLNANVALMGTYEFRVKRTLASNTE